MTSKSLRPLPFEKHISRTLSNQSTFIAPKIVSYRYFRSNTASSLDHFHVNQPNHSAPPLRLSSHVWAGFFKLNHFSLSVRPRGHNKNPHTSHTIFGLKFYCTFRARGFNRADFWSGSAETGVFVIFSLFTWRRIRQADIPFLFIFVLVTESDMSLRNIKLQCNILPPFFP